MYFCTMLPCSCGFGGLARCICFHLADSQTSLCIIVHIINCLMNISLFLWQSEPVLNSICLHEMWIVFIFQRLCQIRATKPFAIVKTERIVSIYMSMIISWKSEFSHFNDSFIKIRKPRICCPKSVRLNLVLDNWVDQSLAFYSKKQMQCKILQEVTSLCPANGRPIARVTTGRSLEIWIS